MRIDLNCDMGESFGAYTIGRDEELMPLITSANIACGFHAGDPSLIESTVQLAKRFSVSVGAHPGFRDLAGFGRRAIEQTVDQIESEVLYQIGALAGFAQANGLPLVHVKPHGALYNMAAVRPDMARAIARAISRLDSKLIMVGLAGSALVDAAREYQLNFAREGFADRAYRSDGTLLPRREPGSVIIDPRRAAEQALRIVREQTVITAEGVAIPLEVDTLCLHGDNPAAVENAHAVREALEHNGVTVMALGK